MNDLNPSLELIEHVKVSEKLVLVPYVDAAGYTTWGWGHKARPGEYVPPAITQDQAELLLAADLHIAAQGVRRHIEVEMTQPQFDGFVDFTFNLGEPQFAGSTMLRLFNAGDADGAADECRKWDHAHVRGQLVVLLGLTIRREWDADRIADEPVKPWRAEDVIKDPGPLVFPPIDTAAPVPADVSAAPAADTPAADAT